MPTKITTNWHSRPVQDKSFTYKGETWHLWEFSLLSSKWEPWMMFASDSDTSGIAIKFAGQLDGTDHVIVAQYHLGQWIDQ